MNNLRRIPKSVWFHIFSVGIILIIAVPTYLVGLHHCLPQHHCDPDEKLRVLETRQHGTDGTYARYNHPNLTLPYIVVHTHNPDWETVPDYTIIAWGRNITLFFALASFIVFYILAYFFSTSYLRSVLYTLLFVASPLYYHFAHVYRSDIPVTFFILLMLLLVELYQRYIPKRTFYHILFGCLFGGIIALATLTKWPGVFVGVFVIPSLVANIRVREYGHIFKVLAALILSGTITTLIIDPSFIHNFSKILESVMFEHAQQRSDWVRLGIVDKTLYYLQTMIEQIGVLPMITAGAGLFLIIYKYIRKQSVEEYINKILMFLVFFFLFLLYTKVHSFRWIIPLVPIMILFAIYALENFWNSLKRKNYWYILFAVIAIMPLIRFTLLVPAYAQTDTRLKHEAWVQKTEISLEQSLYQGYTGLKPDGHGYLVAPGTAGREFDSLSSLDDFLDIIEEHDIQYIHMSGEITCRSYDLDYKPRIEILNYIQEEYELAAEFPSTPADTVYGDRYDCTGMGEWQIINFIFDSEKESWFLPKGTDILVYKVKI